MVRDADMDRALGRFLNDTSALNRDVLVAFGPAALERALYVFAHGSDEHPLIPKITVKGYDAADAWGIAIAALGRAFPDEFLSHITQSSQGLASGDPLLVVATVGPIDRPQAQRLLSDLADHPDYIVRHHAIKGLAWRPDPGSIEIVERHLQDPDPLVRLEAIRGVVRRDRSRAAALLRTMHQEPDLPPLLRAEVQELLASLRRG